MARSVGGPDEDGERDDDDDDDGRDAGGADGRDPLVDVDPGRGAGVDGRDGAGREVAGGDLLPELDELEVRGGLLVGFLEEDLRGDADEGVAVGRSGRGPSSRAVVRADGAPSTGAASARSNPSDASSRMYGNMGGSLLTAETDEHVYPVFDRIRISLCCLVVGGCAPGWIDWGDGTDVLRTAIVVEERIGDADVASILLSNGDFTCEEPTSDDPNEMTQQLTALQNAACREGARHVFVRLFRTVGQDWTGSYDGVDQVVEVGRGERVAEGSYYAVEEAFLVETPLLERAYAAAEEVRELEAAVGGVVEIERDGDRLVGAFQFPDVDVQGEFRATWCGADAGLLRLLAPVPFHHCTP